MKCTYKYSVKILRVVDGDTADALVTLEPQRLVLMGEGVTWWDSGFYFFALVADAQRLPRTMQRFRLERALGYLSQRAIL